MKSRVASTRDFQAFWDKKRRAGVVDSRTDFRELRPKLSLAHQDIGTGTKHWIHHHHSHSSFSYSIHVPPLLRRSPSRVGRGMGTGVGNRVGISRSSRGSWIHRLELEESRASLIKLKPKEFCVPQPIPVTRNSSFRVPLSRSTL